MEAQTEVKSWQLSKIVLIGCFVVMLLLSLDGFHSAEVAAKGHGWYMKCIIGVPWVFALLAGVSLWAGRKRGVMSEQIAVNLMFLFGCLVSMAYEAMGKLAGLIH